MIQDEETIEAAKPVADSLEPYRRLIELQKQMIELVQQHEKTKGECTALRAQLLDEMAGSRRPWRRLRQGFGWLTASRLKGIAATWKARVKNRHRPAGPSVRTFPFRNPTSHQSGYD
jgi:hypothetical protein